jgi:hypothetical protein
LPNTTELVHPKVVGGRLSRDGFANVAQTSSLLYRRLPVGSRMTILAQKATPTRADWKSATQQTGSLRYVRNGSKQRLRDARRRNLFRTKQRQVSVKEFEKWDGNAWHFSAHRVEVSGSGTEV